ncbi:MAG: ribosome-associated translation inhibitor RaiA [Deltaproteobacteria bacterium]|nr:ribosome-associated translation inhibitor RaiA [Deltaproteobacteria bacterium]
MQIMVTFRHVDSSDHLKQYIEEKLGRLDKYFDSASEAHVVLRVEKFRHTADVALSSDGLWIRGAEETEDMYSAIDMVVDKIEKQVKRRLDKRRRRKQPNETIRSMDLSENVPEATGPEEGEELLVVETRRVQTKPMDIDEAIMQLELVKNEFLVFTNARSNSINVLYRRKDGRLRLIEPA